MVTNSCAFYTLRTRLRVRRAPGIPHALSGEWFTHNPGVIAARDRFPGDKPAHVAFHAGAEAASRGAGVDD